MAEMNAALPERIILDLMNLGVNAIVADLATNPAVGASVIESILKELEDDTERGKVRTIWEQNPPSVVQGFARTDSPFPLYALTLGGEQPNQDYIGLGEQAFLNQAGTTKAGQEFHKRTQGTFTIFVYTEHPDWTAWNYRIMRHILNVGTKYLVGRGLQEPTLSGADLMPDPQYTPDNLFTRRLTITVEFEERWTDQDALWLAINGSPEEFITEPDQIDVRHRYSEEFPGGVDPFNV